MLRLGCTIVGGLLLASPVGAEQVPIRLKCSGQGSTNQPGKSVTYRGNDGKFRTAVVGGPTVDNWTADLLIEINGDQGRVLLPQPMWRGQQEEKNWKVLKDIVITESTISARSRLALMTVGEITVNRFTREIRFSTDLSRFGGVCEKSEAPTERAF